MSLALSICIYIYKKRERHIERATRIWQFAKHKSIHGVCAYPCAHRVLRLARATACSGLCTPCVLRLVCALVSTLVRIAAFQCSPGGLVCTAPFERLPPVGRDVQRRRDRDRRAEKRRDRVSQSLNLLVSQVVSLTVSEPLSLRVYLFGTYDPRT